MGEYQVWELGKSPYAKFKVKVFESAEGLFTGYSNLQVADELGGFYCAVGYGKTESKALEDTIHAFLKMVGRKEQWNEDEFRCVDPFDF